MNFLFDNQVLCGCFVKSNKLLNKSYKITHSYMSACLLELTVIFQRRVYYLKLSVKAMNNLIFFLIGLNLTYKFSFQKR